MILRSLLISFYLFFGVSFTANSLEIAKLTSPVIDEAGILHSSSKTQIENILFDLKKTHGVQLQVYVIKSLEGEDIAAAAIKIFD